MPRFLYHTRRSAPLRKFINPTIPLSLHRYVMQVIAELCKSKDPYSDEEIVGEIIPALCALIHHQDTNILVKSALAFSYLADGGSGQIQMIIDTGVVPFLVSLLSSKIVEVQSAALKAVGNLATGSDDQTQVILDCGALSHFAVLLSHSEKFITKWTMWVLSNIIAGTRKQIQAVIDAGLLPEIIRHLDEGVNFQIQKEAAWAVSNLTNSGSDIQITALVENNAIKPLCKLLTNEDDQVVQVCMDGISNILGSSRRNDSGNAQMMIEEFGGVEKIEVLQNSSRAQIRDKAYDILDRYFCEEDSDEVSSYDEAATHSDNQSDEEDQTIGQDQIIDHQQTIDEDPVINENPSINEGPPMDEDPSIEDLSIVEEPSSTPQAEQSGL